MSAPAKNEKPTLSAIPGGQAPTSPQTKFFKKGARIFEEGEHSRAMYLIRSGMVRIFKKKGESFVEIDSIHSGQIVGELAFLDGNARSASGEALTDCELTEISGPVFEQTLSNLPDWMKILTKTIVGRLRSASNRIRQLESASQFYDYSSDGKRTARYIYLSSIDILKVCSAALLVGSRSGISSALGTELRLVFIQRYANQIMGIPIAKMTSTLDILAQCKITELGEGEAAGKVFLRDPDLLEHFIGYLNEQNLLEPSKRRDISPRGFLVMSLIAKHLPKLCSNMDEITSVNLAQIKSLETPVDGPLAGKEPFRYDDFNELVTLGYGTQLQLKSSEEVFSRIHPTSFLRAHQFQKICMQIKAVNEQHSTGLKLR